MKKPYILPITVAVITALVIGYWLRSTVTSVTSDRSPEQIFTEVSKQLEFSRAQVVSFRIFSQDKVQYSFGNGITFAYKDGGVWHISGPVSSQEVPLCSTLATVPEQYRQACYDNSTGENLYTDADGQNLHYPYSQMITYIGQ